ncbi:MAG: helix-turn-helix transcriptional regulator [Candidatus Heimdallarchaeota archaeon]|nr:helix-turn-helix transcriptional regulator [Candidatus Heimdallarchaeota archaeon]MBY8994354.1 helix-turn-helix transcriptional regulator [Candidatus Heimdallarchaeota archaeon]
MSKETTKLKKDQRKESILDTALKVMSEKGIEATTMREIAKVEGISETLLYRYFKNKQEIFFALIQSRAERTFQGLEELAETIKSMIPDPTVSLPIIWKLGKGKMLENKDIISLLIKEREKMKGQFNGVKPFAEKPMDRSFAFKLFKRFQKLQFDTIFTDYFTRCLNEGNLRKDIEPKDAARMFIGLMIPPTLPPFFSHKNPMNGFDEDALDEFIQAQIKIFLQGILPVKK